MAGDSSSSPSIAPESERIDLKTVARLAGSGRGGRPAHISAVRRWITEGIRLKSGGRVYLEATYTPSGWLSSRRSVENFLRTLTADRLGRDPEDEGAGTGAATPETRARSAGRRSAAERRAASMLAAKRLQEFGC